MTTKVIIPVLFLSKPVELPAQLIVANASIHLITASVDDVPVRFVKDSDGWFKSEKAETVDAAYLGNIEVQLNRMFR